METPRPTPTSEELMRETDPGQAAFNALFQALAAKNPDSLDGPLAHLASMDLPMGSSLDERLRQTQAAMSFQEYQQARDYLATTFMLAIQANVYSSVKADVAVIIKAAEQLFEPLSLADVKEWLIHITQPTAKNLEPLYGSDMRIKWKRRTVGFLGEEFAKEVKRFSPSESLPALEEPRTRRARLARKLGKLSGPEGMHFFNFY